jgi:hypothetical protein
LQPTYRCLPRTVKEEEQSKKRKTTLPRTYFP